MKIIAVGDLHGDWGSLNGLITEKNPDIILQTGDFGWWPAMEITKPVLYSRKEKPWKLHGIKPHETKVYWCDGNHEDHDSLREFFGEGDYVLELYPGVFYMPRGSVLTLPDGRNVMFIGGAYSIDKHHRKQGIDWFPEELINYREQTRALSFQGRIDIVISHTCPEEWDPRPDSLGKRTE